MWSREMSTALATIEPIENDETAVELACEIMDCADMCAMAIRGIERGNPGLASELRRLLEVAFRPLQATSHAAAVLYNAAILHGDA